jgi:hypothetical protein
MMLHKIVLQEKKDYIRLEITGTGIPANEKYDAANVLARVADICNVKQIHRVLVISKMTGNLSPLAAYSIADLPEEYGWSRSFKLAIVDLNEEYRKGNTFIETVAVNRGYDVKVFENEKDAKDWLLVKNETCLEETE